MPTVDPGFPAAGKHDKTLEETCVHIRCHTKTPIHTKYLGCSFDSGTIDTVLAQPGHAHLHNYHGISTTDKIV
jgi:hypothetical protein